MVPPTRADKPITSNRAPAGGPSFLKGHPPLHAKAARGPLWVKNGPDDPETALLKYP
jgi:hypothetical protein